MSRDQSFDLVAQLLAHLESLRAAGITFVPAGRALELPATLPRLNAVELQQVETFKPSAETPIIQSAPAQPAPAYFVSPLAPSDGSSQGPQQALKVLAEEIGGCNLCGELFSTRTQTVFGVGPVDPELALIGEAPNADDDRQGEPFVGEVGQLLNRIIAACGFSRDEIYLFNTVKCKPPNRRPPHASECSNCRPYFERQFELVNPKYLVALGATAARNLLNTGEGLASLRGRVHEYRGRPLICTFHPSYLLGDERGQRKRECWDDMKLLLRTMGRPIPEVKRG